MKYSIYINHYHADKAYPPSRIEPEVQDLLNEKRWKVITVAELYEGTRKTGDIVSVGLSKCVVGDKFKRKTGVKIAVERALRDAGLSREERTQIWNRVWHSNEKASA